MQSECIKENALAFVTQIMFTQLLVYIFGVGTKLRTSNSVLDLDTTKLNWSISTLIIEGLLSHGDSL